MASTQDYLEFVLDLLSEIPEVTHRKMMGEYVLYSGASSLAASTTIGSC